MVVNFCRAAFLIVLVLPCLSIASKDIVDIRRSVGSLIYHLCSGIIVDSQWVLTTRDCSNRVHSIVGGEINSEIVEGTEQTVKPVSKVDHQNYSISLIKVTPPFLFNENVQPSNLASADTIVADGTMLATSGWNPATNGGFFQPILQFTDLISSPANEICKYEPTGEDYICVSSEENTRCAGEKGSPLYCESETEKVLCAMTVSKGDCFQASENDLPPPPRINQVGLLTSSFVNWILETIKQK